MQKKEYLVDAFASLLQKAAEKLSKEKEESTGEEKEDDEEMYEEHITYVYFESSDDTGREGESSDDTGSEGESSDDGRDI